MMHPDEIAVPDDLARRLLDTQFPQYADLPLRRLPPIGTDHHLFRLGDGLAARFPKIAGAAAQAHSDDTWLRRLAPRLPLEVPVPLGLGEPTDDYPLTWSVVPWIDGENPRPDNIDPVRLAQEVGAFVRGFRDLDPMDGPLKKDGARGAPLVQVDGWVREWTAKAGDRVDGAAVLEVWEDALAAPVWQHDPVWLVADIQDGNTIVRDGHVVGMIDFLTLGRGDPAVELMPCWGWFSDPAARAAYRDAVDLDEDAWRRARGWALAPAVSGLVYYEETSPEHARSGRETVAAVLQEFAAQG